MHGKAVGFSGCLKCSCSGIPVLGGRTRSNIETETWRHYHVLLIPKKRELVVFLRCVIHANIAPYRNRGRTPKRYTQHISNFRPDSRKSTSQIYASCECGGCCSAHR